MKIYYWSTIFLAVLLQGCAMTPSLQSSNPQKPYECRFFQDKNFLVSNEDPIKDSYPFNHALWNEFDRHYQNAKGRKLVVFMDGTRNHKKDLTNIRKLYLLAVAKACEGTHPVIPYYDKGVNAKWFEWFYGGAPFGTGISLNIRQAYRFLSQTYKPGDNIYIFGFSRGAFTARSLNGFLEFAGLLDGTKMKNNLSVGLQWITKFENIVENLYDQYNVEVKKGNQEELKNDIKEFERNYPDQTFNKVKVEAIGVFDTVPALGIKRIDEPKSHRLNLYANRGFHALSLDEQREDFKLVRFVNDNPKEQQLTEVWFPGVHSNIGGGYSHTFGCNTCSMKTGGGFYDGLETTPLNWILSKFKNDNIFPNIKPLQECIDGKLHDEYFNGSTYRIFGNTLPRKPRAGDVIHESVLKRMKIPSLMGEVRNPQREPIGKYIPNNLNYPIPCHYKIETNESDGAKNKSTEFTCK